MVRLAGAVLTAILALWAAAISAGGEVRAVDRDAQAAERQVGVPVSETIALEGGATTLTLANGGVVQGSEWVYIGLSRAKRGLDYTIDYSTGQITLARPTPHRVSVKVQYCHAKRSGPAGGASGLGTLNPGMPALTLQPLISRENTGAELGRKGVQTVTYGVDTLLNLGGDSAVSGLWFLSAPQDSRGPQSPLRAVSDIPVKASSSDRLVVQNADLGLGGLRVRMGYQSVGADFKGFDTVGKLGAAQQASMKALEKEKGIKRLDMAADMAVGSDGGLSFAMSRVLDHSGEVSSRIFGFSGSGFAASYGTREVGRSFKRFGDLREADSGQMAAEVGLRRSVLGIRSGGSSKTWNSVRVSQLSGEGGGVTSTAVGLEFGRMSLSADLRSGSAKFGRMNALDDSERSAMALAVRRQFDPGAKPDAVTQADRNQFNGETGLSRANYMAGWRSGSLSTSLRASRVGSANGGIGRTALSVEGKGFGVRWSRQRIDEGFDRLGSLQPVERAAFGNERGMSRSNLAGELKTGGAEVRLDRSQVTDHRAGVLRQTLGVKTPKLNLQMGFQDISPRFGRVMDLADGDRQALVGDVGFSRRDYTLSLRPDKSLAVDWYVNDASNATDGRERSVRRHEIAYMPDHGPQLKMLSDVRRQTLADGALVGSSEQSFRLTHRLNIAGGARLELSRDAHSSIDAESQVRASRISRAHIESEKQGRMSFVFDTLDAIYEDGKSESVQSVGVRSKLGIGKGMGIYGQIERVGAGNAAQGGIYGTLGLDWAISDQLKMTFNLENVGRGANAGRRSRQFSLNGLLAERLLFLNNITIGSGVNMANRNGEQIGCDNAFRMEARLFGGSVAFANGDKMDPNNHGHRTTRLLSYASDPDPKRCFHVSFSDRDEQAPFGERVTRTELTADAKTWRNGMVTFKCQYGGKAAGASFCPLTASSLKFSQNMPNSMILSLDYARAVNGATRTRSRSLGLSLAGKLRNNADYELLLGRALSDEAGKADEGAVVRIRYDHKIDDEHYISFSARKSVGGAKTGAGGDQGDVSARIDMQMDF